MEEFQANATPENESYQAPSPYLAPVAEPSPNPGVSKKPRVWTVFLAAVAVTIIGLGATTVYIVIAGLVVMGLDGARNTAGMTQRILANPNIMIPSFAAMGISALFVTGICGLLSRERFLDRVSLRASHLDGKGYAAAVAVTFGASMAAAQIGSFFTQRNSGALKLLQDTLRSANSFMFALAVIIIAGLAPIAEEVFFRGYMQTRLRQRWGPAWAIGITALAFGLFHADPVQSPFAVVIGVALGYVAEKAGSIRPAIVCHSINNLVAVIVARSTESEAKPSGQWIVLAVAISVCLSGVLWFRRNDQVNGSGRMAIEPQSTL